MSHYFYLKCQRCGDSSERLNHGHDALVEMVKKSLPLWKANQAGWDVESCSLNSYYAGTSTVRFVVSHFDHGPFIVEGEYSSDPKEEVVPDGEGIQQAYLANITGDVTELERRLIALKSYLGAIS